MNKKKKILTTSVIAWNDKVGANTLSSLLEGYGADDVANIYIRPELPNSPVCRHYLQITENDIIKSVLKPSHPTAHRYDGTETAPSKEAEETQKAEETRYRRFKKMRLYLFLLARELAWVLGKWKTKELDRFIDEFSPDIVLYSVDGYMHMNRISRYAVKRSGAKAVAIVWDDNFSYKTDPKTPGYLLHRFLLRKSFKKTIALAQTVFSFTPMCQRELKETFGIDSRLLTKPVRPCPRPVEPLHKPLLMVYTGNLLYGREKTLAMLSKALDRLNQDEIKIELHIYTTTALSPSMQKKMTCRGVTLCGAVPQAEAFDRQAKADILLFLEALTGSKKHVARLSFSTKLTDYFSMGKCIFAIGPSDIAPIQYLQEKDAAVTVTSPQEILPALQALTENRETVTQYGEKAYETGVCYHSEEAIRAAFLEAVEKS